MRYKSAKNLSGHAGILFVLMFPVLFGAFVWATDGARMLQTSARLTDAMEVAVLAVSAENSEQTEERKTTAQRFVKSYFPDVPLDNVVVTSTRFFCEQNEQNPNCGSQKRSFYQYELDVSIKREAIFKNHFVNSEAVDSDGYFSAGRSSVARKGLSPDPIDLILVADYSGSMEGGWNGGFGSKYSGLQSVIKDIADQIQESNDKVGGGEDNKSRLAVVGYDMYTADGASNFKDFRSNVYCIEQYGIDESCSIDGQYFRELIEPRASYWNDYGDWDYNRWSRTSLKYRLSKDYLGGYEYKRSHEAYCDKRKNEDEQLCKNYFSYKKYLYGFIKAEGASAKIDVAKTIDKIFDQKSKALTAYDVKTSAVFRTINLTSDTAKLKSNIDGFYVPNPGSWYLKYSDGGSGQGKQKYYSATAFYSGLIRAAQIADEEGKQARRMIIILSDGQDSYNELSKELVDKGLCSTISSYLNAQKVMVRGREESVKLELAAIGFDYNVESYPAIKSCVGESNVYKANNISEIKEKILTLISEEVGTLVR